MQRDKVYQAKVSWKRWLARISSRPRTGAYHAGSRTVSAVPKAVSEENFIQATDIPPMMLFSLPVQGQYQGLLRPVTG
jgi:hypothetical protein